MDYAMNDGFSGDWKCNHNHPTNFISVTIPSNHRPDSQSLFEAKLRNSLNWFGWPTIKEKSRNIRFYHINWISDWERNGRLRLAFESCPSTASNHISLIRNPIFHRFSHNLTWDKANFFQPRLGGRPFCRSVMDRKRWKFDTSFPYDCFPFNNPFLMFQIWSSWTKCWTSLSIFKWACRTGFQFLTRLSLRSDCASLIVCCHHQCSCDCCMKFSWLCFIDRAVLCCVGAADSTCATLGSHSRAAFSFTARLSSLPNWTNGDNNPESFNNSSLTLNKHVIRSRVTWSCWSFPMASATLWDFEIMNDILCRWANLTKVDLNDSKIPSNETLDVGMSESPLSWLSRSQH
jgi:hypothetical protein